MDARRAEHDNRNGNKGDKVKGGIKKGRYSFVPPLTFGTQTYFLVDLYYGEKSTEAFQKS